MSTPGAARRMLLAIVGLQRRPRVVPPDRWKWAKAWARRWWHVEAASADQARLLIERTELGLGVEGACVLDCGRNARGGPDAMPTHHRKEPAVRPARA